jgi:acid stress chaperone HdeB
MTKARLALGALILALFSIARAEAQVTIDVAKITCEQFILYQVVSSDYIAVWLDGYYNAKRNNTLVDTQAFKANVEKVKNFCRQNFPMPVMQAVEAVLGEKK